LVNSIPVAANDSVHSEGQPVTVTVLGNDTDADPLDPLTIVNATNGVGGTVAIQGSSITYTPGASYTGDDVFLYTISDGYGGVATASVTVQAEGTLTRTAAITAAAVPGAPGMSFTSLQVPSIGDDLITAWLANASSASVKKKTLLIAGNPAAALFGNGDVIPGSSGLTFTKLGTPVCDDAGASRLSGRFCRTRCD
jgi:hypothetical protein